MDVAIYEPTITTSLVVDTYDNAANLKYVANTTMASQDGILWAGMDGSQTVYVEGGADQQIWMTRSDDDGQSWSDPFQPFRDAAHCVNPMTGTEREWQPGLVSTPTLGLWGSWSAEDGYLSKLATPGGKWQNFRFEFVGTQPYLSTTMTGAPTAGRSVSPTIDGISDWRPFFAGDPIVLESGVVMMPATLYSRGTYSTETDIPNGFTKLRKLNAVFISENGTDWSMTMIGSTFGDFVAWEPYVVQNPGGQILVFSRNLDPNANVLDSQLVARSDDGGASFSPSVSTKMVVPQTRGSAIRVGARLWLMLHCDREATQVGNTGRENGALFVSRRGFDDFVPGVNWSQFDALVKYPQGIVHSGKLLINYTSGNNNGNTAGKGRFGYRLTTVSPLPDDGKAYLWPRHTPLTISDPDLIDTAPPTYQFDGYQRMLSAATIAPAGAMSFVAWLNAPYDPPIDAAIVDTRSGLSGSIFRFNGVSLRSMDVFHGWDLPLGKPLFLAAVIDPTAMTVTHYTASGQGDFVSRTKYFRSISFSGQPSNNETITINSVVYTFKSSASLTNEVQIGASTAATCANLKTAVEAAMNTANSNETSNLITDTRLIVIRGDGATFAASSAATNVTVETSVSLTGGKAYVGTSIPGSSVPAFRGHVYDARIYDSALSVANLRQLYNARATTFGYSVISGTSTAPSSPLLRVDPATPDADAFPSVGGKVHCETVSNDLLRLHGEASAGMDMRFGVNVWTVPYKLGAAPTGTDKYVIASFGTRDHPARLYIDAANPTKLYCNGKFVANVATPTADGNVVSVTVATNYIRVGTLELYVPGKPRAYLGNAWAEGLLPVTKYIDFDRSHMTVNPG